MYSLSIPQTDELICITGGKIQYDIFINCSWVVTWWQYTFTHKQYIEQHK
jgi:hypothetical protein